MKKVLTALALLILGAGGVALYVKLKPDPPVESKFVQNVDIEAESQDPDGASSETSQNIIFKKPGNFALVNIPNHTYQTFNNCGAATMSMILSFYGQNVSQKVLGDLIRPYQVASGDNDDKTIFTYEFVDYVKRYNVEAIGRVNGDVELLKTFTANGIPVVVKTWLHVNEDIGHFRIVRGFDESQKSIIQDDSFEGPNRRISYFDFLSMWQPFNYDYIIVYTPEQKELVEAILGDELDENVAWQNALARAQKESQLDAENVYPWFNMSSAYYNIGNYQESVAAFEKVENRLPKRMLWYQIEPILAYQKLGNYDRVFQITDNVLNNGNRAYSELYQIRGEIYLAQGNIDAARQQFELAVQYNKNYTPAQESLKNL